MGTSRHASWDGLAAVAVVLTAATIAVYVQLMVQQDGRPAAWFVGGLVAGVVLGAYGVVRPAAHRRGVLAVNAILLAVLGIAGLASLGFLLLIASVATIGSAGRGLDGVRRATTTGH